jgi:CubicO group peptidase (beta-lactamase class C family)
MIDTAVRMLVASVLLGCAQEDDGPHPSNTNRFEWISAPSRDGDTLATAVRRLLDAVTAGRYGAVRSLFVARDDTVLVDTAFAPEARGIQPYFSVAKTVTAALAGIAVARGELGSVDAPVADFLPDSLLPLALSNGWSSVRVEHLLTMTVGIQWDETGISVEKPRSDFQLLMESPDPVALVISRRIIDPSGQQFGYCSGATLVLSRILQQATGKPIADYAREQLFDPLGIDSVFWHRIAGMTNGATGIAMASGDLARIGRVFLKGGLWDGKVVVPPEWTAASWEARSDPSDARADFYGYGWFGLWLDSLANGSRNPPASTGGRGRMLYAFGHKDQVLAVLPEQRLVVVVTANHADEEYERVGAVRMILEWLVVN